MSEGNKAVPLDKPPVMPTDPRAAAYAKRSGLSKYQEPIAGGPTPPIPRLDQEHVGGAAGNPALTMSQQAVAQRARQGTMPGSIVQPPPQAGPDIRPLDLLTPEAMNDPAFVKGQGSMYAVAQPALAMRYGVIREGKPVSPQMLRARPTTPGGQPKMQLSPETVQDLKTLEELREKSLKAESGELAAEEASRTSSAGAAAGIGTSRREDLPERPMSAEEVKSYSTKDDIDMQMLHEMMVRDVINNEEQKKLVESRLSPLNLADLIVDGTITQVVPIIPGVFEPEFQTISGEEDLNMKRMLVEEAKTLKVDDRYLLDKFAIMGIACALKSVNKSPLPSHRDENGDFSEEKLEVKFKRVLKFPLAMLAALGPHYFWFDQRVRKLFIASQLKNG